MFYLKSECKHQLDILHQLPKYFFNPLITSEFCN